MIFSKLGRSVARSARSRPQIGSVVGGHCVRDLVLNGSEKGICGANLGALRGFLASVGTASKGSRRIGEWDYLLTNPRFRRFFSSETPKKKNYEKYYPGETKGAPKEQKGKSDTKEDPNSGEQVNFQDFLLKQMQNFIVPAIFLSFFSVASFGSSDKKEISFQEFKNKFLEPGLVDRIVVSNKSVAKVYLKSHQQINHQMKDDDLLGSGAPAKGTGRYMFYFNIGSVESFEEKLEEAQESFGIDSHNYFPVTYVSSYGTKNS